MICKRNISFRCGGLFKTHEHAFELKRHDKDKIKLLRLKYLQHAKKIKGIAFD